jgi:hypothetical protein
MLPSDSLFYVDVNVWCSAKKQMVRVTLACPKKPKGDIVKGKPVYCFHERNCDLRDRSLCLLKAIQIETKR